MKLSVNDRIIEIVKLLINSSGYMSADEIAERLQISKRNVYYALNDINKILKNLDKQEVLSEYGKGLRLNNSQKSALNLYYKILPSVQIESLGQLERCSFMYCETYAAEDKLTIKDFEDTFEISRFTIINCINYLKILVSSFGVEVIFDSKSGYKIEGSEYNKRKAFFYFFSNIYGIITENNSINQRFTFLDDKSAKQYKNLLKIEEATGNGYYDCSLRALACIISHSKASIEEHDVENCLPHKIVHTEYEFVAKACKYLPENEKEYMATYLYCSSISRAGTFNNIEMMTSMARKMNDIFYLLTTIEIHSDEFELALAKHLDIAFLRYKYGISIDNPLIGQIKKNYETYFSVTQKAAKVIEKEINTPLNDNEIGFLTLYYAGYAVKQQIEIPVVRAILICINGLATSYLLKSEIETLDKRITVEQCISLQEYAARSYDKDSDVIFSSIGIRDSDRHPDENLMMIGSILSDSDKVKITNEASRIIFEKTYNRTNEKEAALQKLNQMTRDITIEPVYTGKEIYQSHIAENIFKYEFVQTCDSRGKSFEELIRIAAKPLIQEKYIDDTYCDAIIANIYKHGPYMVFRNGYLLGHASIQLSNRLGLSFLRLSDPVDVNGREASKIFIITPTDKVSHIPLINSLVVMLDSNEINDLISKATSNKELYNIVLSVISAC